MDFISVIFARRKEFITEPLPACLCFVFGLDLVYYLLVSLHLLADGMDLKLEH